MIPKTIHYVWVGESPLTDSANRCIESWRISCPDYMLVRWDESNFDMESNPYVKEAYMAKKWAFVSDYIRLWALVNFGGIYLDTDVEVIKPLDAFLSQKAFAGFETSDRVSTAMLGCEKGFALFQDFLCAYENRSFFQEDGSMDVTTNVASITKACLAHGLKLNGEKQTIAGFTVYPKDWFCAKDYSTGKQQVTSNTHAIHHFDGSWLTDEQREILAYSRKWLDRYSWMSETTALRLAKLRHVIRYRDFEFAKKALRNKLNH